MRQLPTGTTTNADMYARTNKSHRGLMLFHQNRCQVLALRVHHVLIPSISQTLQLSNLGLCRDVCVYLKSSFCMSAFSPRFSSFLFAFAEIDNTCSNYEGLASLLSLTAVATIFSATVVVWTVVCKDGFIFSKWKTSGIGILPHCTLYGPSLLIIPNTSTSIARIENF